jgi:hypothetical protein
MQELCFVHSGPTSCDIEALEHMPIRWKEICILPKNLIQCEELQITLSMAVFEVINFGITNENQKVSGELLIRRNS